VSFYEFGWWKTHPTDTFDESKMRQIFPEYPEITFHQYMESVFRTELLDTAYLDAGTRDALESADCGPLTIDYIRFMSRDPARVVGNLPDFLNRKTHLEEFPNTFRSYSRSEPRALCLSAGAGV
jgi:hypothetical protein